MKSLPNIQELIDEKATNRLEKDLCDMRDTILNIPILRQTGDGIPKIQFGDNQSQPYWFFNRSEPYAKALYEYWLPIYKNQETENFLKRVEELESNVNDLLNTQHTHDY